MSSSTDRLACHGPHVSLIPRSTDAAMEIEACRILPGQIVQTVSVDVGDADAVEKAMSEVVAKQGTVQVVRDSGDRLRVHVRGSTLNFARFITMIQSSREGPGGDAYSYGRSGLLSGLTEMFLERGSVRLLLENSIEDTDGSRAREQG